MCVCARLCVHVRVCTHTQAHARTHTYVHTHTHIYIYTYTYIHTHIHTNIYGNVLNVLAPPLLLSLVRTCTRTPSCFHRIKLRLFPVASLALASRIQACTGVQAQATSNTFVGAKHPRCMCGTCRVQGAHRTGRGVLCMACSVRVTHSNCTGTPTARGRILTRPRICLCSRGTCKYPSSPRTSSRADSPLAPPAPG